MSITRRDFIALAEGDEVHGPDGQVVCTVVGCHNRGEGNDHEVAVIFSGEKKETWIQWDPSGKYPFVSDSQTKSAIMAEKNLTVVKAA